MEDKILSTIDLIRPFFEIFWDFILVSLILKFKFSKKDSFLVALIILFGAYFNIEALILNLEYNTENIIEMCVLGLYFYFYKKYNFKISLLNGLLLVCNIDLGVSVIGNILDLVIPIKDSFYDFYVIILGVASIWVVFKCKNLLNRWITDQNKYLFLILNLYVYITGNFIYESLVKLNNFSIIVQLSIIIFIVQLLFLVGMYIVAVKTRKNILDKVKQKQKEIELKQLKLENKRTSEEYARLKEYAEYLDKSEDELRKFKHDYQNILNSLRVSAENNNATELIKKLDQYTNSQISNKALKKYKGINHVKAEGLKSIAIAKLAKLYNLKIDYTFDCVKDVTSLPAGVNELDVTRIIGIAFDNAIEASLEMCNKNQKPFVAAMYLEEDGTFEFEIRNKVFSQESTKKISQKGYTTKKDHLGIGLANVKEIAKKYRENVLIDYGYNENYFVFNLVVVPFKDWEESEN